MKRCGAILFLALFLTQCKTTDTSETKGLNEVTETSDIAPSETKTNFCFDSRRMRVRCAKDTVLTHAGCSETDYMRRCGDCIQIAAMTCGPGTVAVEVPECKEKGYGDCVPL